VTLTQRHRLPRPQAQYPVDLTSRVDLAAELRYALMPMCGRWEPVCLCTCLYVADVGSDRQFVFVVAIESAPNAEWAQVITRLVSRGMSGQILQLWNG
jgi:hypothetical protein